MPKLIRFYPCHAAPFCRVVSLEQPLQCSFAEVDRNAERDTLQSNARRIEVICREIFAQR
ncbi:hypothetical protein CEE69_17510 [Rhodopirellula bahusiensis]|uniref:Uncharacterized protein n=1 Tax=Rhodopirellula bahusiensis TaxID=2014065 RepID=A0A2G1W4W0_9BACT|nr:hypothetical protein CEE69_17510 [Rhodopirellula bahusiensis]